MIEEATEEIIPQLKDNLHWVQEAQKPTRSRLSSTYSVR